jgi:hypothetical protein
MERRAQRKHVKDQASAELSPAEALMLRLENIEPGRLERLGSEEERRLGSKPAQWRGWRMDDASPVGGEPSSRQDEPRCPAPLAWAMPAVSDGAARRAPREWAKVYGDAMSSYGLRHHDRVRLDHDLAPSNGDIVLAEVQGVGRVLRKLSIIGGVHILSADAGVKPIVVDDPLTIIYFGVVIAPTAL